MKTKVVLNGCPKLQITYQEQEWKLVHDLLTKKLMLSEATTSNLFGYGETGKFFRESSGELKQYLDAAIMERIRVRDDINAPLLDRSGTVNIAILRVVPVNNIVEVKLQKYINIVELENIMTALETVMKVLFSLVIEKEVNLTFRKARK